MANKVPVIVGAKTYALGNIPPTKSKFFIAGAALAIVAVGWMIWRRG